MRNRILAFIIICLMIVSFSLNVFSDNEITNSENVNNDSTNTLESQKSEIDSKLNESNNNLGYIQSELSTNLQKVEQLEDSISTYQGKYDALVTQIATAQSKIDETQSKLDEVQEEYNRKELILKKRVVALYESGDTSYIDLLLSSSNIMEFISNYFLISELIECDNEFLDELEDTKSQIEKTKEEQQKQQEDLMLQKREIDQTKILLENTKIVKENYMNQLTNEEKVLQTQIAEYKAQQAEIQSKILAATTWDGTLSIQFTGGIMIWPIAMEGTYITSSFGLRLHPIQGVYKNHDGIDISGSNVYRSTSSCSS